MPSVLWHCWLGGRKGIRPVKIDWWGVGAVICLERGADCLHMVQLMPLHHKTPSSLAWLIWIQSGFTFLVPAYPGRPGKEAVKRLYSSSYFASVAKWSVRPCVRSPCLLLLAGTVHCIVVKTFLCFFLIFQHKKRVFNVFKFQTLFLTTAVQRRKRNLRWRRSATRNATSRKMSGLRRQSSANRSPLSTGMWQFHQCSSTLSQLRLVQPGHYERQDQLLCDFPADPTTNLAQTTNVVEASSSDFGACSFIVSSESIYSADAFW